MSRASVLVAMSGGVDSSVAAAVLVEAGYEVVGVTMKMHDAPEARGAKHGCCTVEDADDARAVAARLGIAHYTVDLSVTFGEHVIGAFVDGYAAGTTPNPCVECNRHVKFTELVERADLLGVDMVATGHHACVDVGGGLRRGADAAKDQSYVLACLDPELLRRTLLPVGELSKAEVRALAAELGLRTAGKAESMEVCFLGGGGVAGFLRPRVPIEPGDVVGPDGTVLGRHDGAVLYTVGQRRGLDTPRNRRLYVHAVDAVANTVTVADAPPVVTSVAAGAASWLGDAGASFEATVQMSAHGTPVSASVEVAPGGSDVRIALMAPAPAPAPGQLAAFYDGDHVLGAATVTAAR